jgi:DNA/RNA endonuclease YhcR with UshA esterase domain
MATTNSVTGDKIQTKNISEQFRNNYDLIFRKDKEIVVELDDTTKDIYVETIQEVGRRINDCS